MKKRNLIMLFFSFISSISGLFAQTFNPINGIDYPIEFIEWTLNGEDKLPEMQSHLRSSSIIFNSDNTVVSFRNSLFNASYTFFPNGSCEFSVRALFIRRTESGTGRIERSGRNFTLFISMQAEGDNMIATIRGNIKQ